MLPRIIHNLIHVQADTPERRFNELNKACHDQNEKPDGEGAATHGTKCEDVEDDH